MTVFGRVTEDGLDYPFDVRKAYPETSFPPEIDKDSLTEGMLEDGVVEVVQTEQPVQEGFYYEHGGVSLSEGVWSTFWDIKPLPPYTELVPRSVSMRQARLALFAEGLLEGVTNAINEMPSGQKEVIQIEWDYAQTVERNSELVSLLGAAVGLDSAGIDELFKVAVSL